IPASLQAWPMLLWLANSTSICRRMATICSALCFFRAMPQLLSYQTFYHFTWYKIRRSRQYLVLQLVNRAVAEAAVKWRAAVEIFSLQRQARIWRSPVLSASEVVKDS